MTTKKMFLVMTLALSMLMGCTMGGQRAQSNNISYTQVDECNSQRMAELEDNIQRAGGIEAYMDIVRSTELSDDAKRVGNGVFGFITIPRNWHHFSDAGMLQNEILHIGFTRMGVGSEIINLVTYGFQENDVKRNLIRGRDYEVVRVENYEAYRLNRHLEEYDFYVISWYFTDSNSALRLITAEAPAASKMKLIDIVERTFSLTK